MQDQRRPASRSRRRGSGAGLLFVLAGVATSACESTTVSVVELSDIELSPSALTLLEGDRQQLAVALTDVDGHSLQDAVVVWDVEDPEVAGVTRDGVVEALTPGRTTVRASSGDVSASAQVTVLAGPTVELEEGSLEVESPPDDETITRTVAVENAGNGTLDGLTARIQGDASWLEVELLDTTAPTELQLRLRPAAVGDGEYEALVLVESTASGKGPAEVRVRLRVRADEPPPPDEPGDDDDDGDDDGGGGGGGDDGGPSCTLSNRLVFGDFDVPAGARCVLSDVRVFGNVRVGNGGRLEARDVRIDGNLSARDAVRVILVEVRVFGNVEHTRGGPLTLRDSFVDGNTNLRDNRGRLDILDNRLGGHLDLRGNRDGPFVLRRNVIDGRLECRGNRPEPQGGGNRADDGARGQCSALQ